MSDIHYTQMTQPVVHVGPRQRQRRWATLPVNDHRHLRQHLEACERSRPPAWAMLAPVLLHKIMSTTPVADTHFPDLVIGGSHITFSIDGGPPQSGVMAHNARSGFGIGAIPVASLLGATLIGMRVGQRAPLLHNDGTISSVLVLDVLQPG